MILGKFQGGTPYLPVYNKYFENLSVGVDCQTPSHPMFTVFTS